MMPESSTALSDYASPEEIAALQAAMRERWKELGRTLRRMQQMASMRDGEAAENLRWQRRCINCGLNLIEQGELPLVLEDCDGAKDILAPFHARYETARAELHKRKAKEIARAPIDDDAWAKELDRRERVDKWLNRS
jgi:hypothetical protein